MSEKFPAADDSQRDIATDNPVIIERRKASSQNGESRIQAGVFVTPDPELINAINEQGNGKVSYFPASEQVAVMAFMDGSASGPSLYHQVVFEPLCVRILQRYPDKRVALRGVMTSVNGVLPDAMGPGTAVLDIVDTVARGVEKPGSSFNVQAMAQDDPLNAVLSLKYIEKYTQNVSFAAKFYTNPTEQTPPDFEEALFPAVLVYDLDGLRNTSDDRFTVAFAEGANPPDVLLEAIVLDKQLK